MRKEDFTQNATGTLVPIGPEEGGIAFVPDPLPPKLPLDIPTVKLLAEAERALGRLEEAVHGLPNPELVVSSFVRAEAVASTRLEGTMTSIEELSLFNAGSPDVEDPDAAKEADNYVEALKLGMELLEELPPSLRVIRRLHERLMQNTRGSNRRDGEFRTVQNRIVENRFDPPELYRYVPPPPNEMTRCLDALDRYMNGERQYPELVELALIHYQFEAIHPFEDGNGRIGRLLVALLLKQWDLLSRPVLRISPYFEARKEEYIDALLGISQTGDWQRWITLFLAAVKTQAIDSAERARRLFQLREEYRATVADRSRSNAALSIVDGLFENIVVSAPIASDLYGINQKTATNAIQLLVEEKILRQLGDHKRNRIYFANGVLFAIHAPLTATSGR